MRLAALGTAGYMPAGGRQTMAFLLATETEALMLDAGTGVARLLEPEIAKLLPAGRRLDVLLTHYHLDHVVGLSYLLGLAADRPVRIHAPAPPLTSLGPEGLRSLLSPPLFPLPIERWPMPVEVVPFSGAELAIGGLRLLLRRQKHPGGSVGVRIGDELAYVTDSVIDPATIEFVRGVKLLLHEVWLTAEEAAETDPAPTGHSDAGAVADLARAAGVGRLWVVHHHPRRSAADLARLAETMQKRAGRPVEVPVEGAVYELE
ncbi:MAG: MBL fold metallo-hydrolase [Thermoanaerobaculia bacterium]